MIPGYAATCTATGLTDGTKCSVCGQIVKAQEEIPTSEHDYAGWVVLEEATATKDGSQSRECRTCGHKDVQTIPATGSTETQPTQPNEPSEPADQTQPGDNRGDDDQNQGNDTILIVAIVALFIAAAAIIVLLVMKKK